MLFHRERRSVLRVLAADAALVAGSLLLIAMRFQPRLQVDPVSRAMVRFALSDVVGWFGLVLFGFMGFVWLRFLLSDKPALELTVDGVIDHTTLISPGKVEWSEIDTLELKSFRGSDWIAMRLTEPAAVFGRIKGVRGSLIRLWKSVTRIDRGTRSDTVYVLTRTLDVAPHRLLGLLKAAATEAKHQRS